MGCHGWFVIGVFGYCFGSWVFGFYDFIESYVAFIMSYCSLDYVWFA